MNAKEFYRKRLIELTPEGITKRINKIVCIDKEVQICEEYHKYKVENLNLADVIVPKGTFCSLYEKECIGVFCSVTPCHEKCEYLKEQNAL